MNARRCDELGLCQSRFPRCVNCTEPFNDLPKYLFAPGVIDHIPKPTPSAARWAMRWVYAMLIISAASAIAGYLS